MNKYQLDILLLYISLGLLFLNAFLGVREWWLERMRARRCCEMAKHMAETRRDGRRRVPIPPAS